MANEKTAHSNTLVAVGLLLICFGGILLLPSGAPLIRFECESGLILIGCVSALIASFGVLCVVKGTLRQKTDSSGTAQSDRTRQVGSGPSHGLFLKRMAATLIDLGVLLVLVSVFMLVEAAAWVSILGVHYCRYGILNNGEIVQRFFAGSIASVAWIYYATLESAVRRQSTCGKMIIGLRVTDLNGAPISFLRASGRYWSMYITLLTCGLGYLPVLFTRKKQALHDIISRCLVVGRMR